MYEHEALDAPVECNARYEVCSACHGTGAHERRDIDCSLLVDSMREDGDDEGLEQYFRGSMDIPCTLCHGANVVLVPELPEWAEKEIREYYDCMAEMRREQEAERRAGA